MIHCIYYERELTGHPRLEKIFQRFPKAAKIVCEHYGEVFNRKAQHFRLQKTQPALILAKKHKGLVLPAPEEYHIGSAHNYYFSHMLNCVYDCRYCFLQGMFRSAHYVLFINYEDFGTAIEDLAAQHDQDVHFFSGYDCDSLALDPMTDFLDYILDVFSGRPRAWLELRSKSTQIRKLLTRPAMQNVITAFSFTPPEIGETMEQGVPQLDKRLQAVTKLQAAGWTIGLRFDPLIYHPCYQEHYTRLFNTIFSQIDARGIHSVTAGVFRMPKAFYRRITRQYPGELVLSHAVDERQDLIQYDRKLEGEMLEYCHGELCRHLDEDRIFLMR